MAQDPDSLLDLWQIKKCKWIVIDEVQKIPRLLDVVHRGIEEFRIKFALTGSSARKLKRGGANLLAGRAIEKNLFPFSAVELGEDFELNRALERGLLPKIWDEKDLTTPDQIDFLFSYVQTYLKEEVAAEQLVRNLDPFRRFLVSAAQSNCKILNYAKIERDSGVPQRQAIRHFEILADTLIGFYLEPFHFSVRKRQIAHSKFYFFDTGVVRALQNRITEPLSVSTFEYGDIFETFLINEFVKINSALGLRWKFSYLKTPSDQEIDLIIEKPRGKPVLVEIKSSATLNKEQLQPLQKLSQEIEHSGAYLLSNSKQEYEKEGVRCLYWLTGLCEIFGLEG